MTSVRLVAQYPGSGDAFVTILGEPTCINSGLITRRVDHAFCYDAISCQ